MKAADYAKQKVTQVTPPPHVFVLPASAFTDRWETRPKKPVPAGLIRVPAEDKVRCDAEAVRLADARLPAHRRHAEDPVWQRIYEVTFIHYLIGMSLTHPADCNKPLWPSQDGAAMLMDVEDRHMDGCPVASSRFTDDGIKLIFDNMDILARVDPVGRRMATDAELTQVGEALSDGSFFARLGAANTSEARAVGEHLRMLAGAMLDLMERGREAPLPMNRPI